MSASTPPTRHVPNPAGMVTLVVAAAAVFALPFVVGEYWSRVLTLCTVYGVAAAGAQVLYGRLGFVSLNQIALVGVGGWVFLRVGHAVALPHPVLLLVAGGVTALVGIVLGLPGLRLSGLSLALVTLMAAGAFEVVFSAVGFPDGGPGFLGRASDDVLPIALPRPPYLGSDAGLLYYAVVVAVLMFGLLWLAVRGRPGRAWMAIRHSVPGAIATGVDVTRQRLVALALVSFVTGVAGGLLATGDGRLDPISFPAQQSIVLFAVVLIGGAYSLLGGALAGLLYSGLPAVLDQVGLNGNLILVVFGVGLVHSLLTAPEGIAGQILALTHRLRRRGAAPVRGPGDAAPEAPGATVRKETGRVISDA